jgi:hypothetical protein
MLAAWERGLEQGHVERGLTLLAAALPGREPDGLAALSIGERDRQLLELREALFGEHLTGLVACPRCAEQVELELSTRELQVEPPRGVDLTLLAGEHEVQLRLPDSRDLLAVAAAGAAGAPALLFERCVVSARIGAQAADAGALPPHVVAEAGRRLAQADPQADVQFAVTCPACGHAWSAPFDVVPFVWAELDAWAGRLFADVHALACAYGWTESEILALSPARRSAYLDMVGA